MTVFKTFFKIMLKYKFLIIMYTAITVFFAGFNTKNNSTAMDFSETKPTIYIVNNDEEVGITQNLIQYLKNKSNIAEIENSESAIDDAIFYRDVDLVIYIPQNYREDFLNNKNPQIKIKRSTGYLSELANMNLNRYLKVAQRKVEDMDNEDNLISEINSVVEQEVEVELRSKLDTTTMQKLSRYFSFSSYSILAISIFVLCTVLTVFKEEKISKRTNVSSLNYKKFNRSMLLSSSVFGVLLWVVFMLLSIILIGNGVFSIHGLVYAINMFIFVICALCLSVFLGNLLKDKKIANVMVNVIALGSSFLCGAFVPVEFLPDFVLKIAHILPTYWYINSNGIIEVTNSFTMENLKPIIINSIVLIGFSIFFVILTNIVSKKKQKVS